jgi:hypothetical protein
MSSNTIARIATAALVLAAPALGTAQSNERPSRFEIRVPAGQLIGTGAQRNQLKNGSTTALQLSWLLRSQLAITGTFSWSRSRDVATDDAPRLDVFTSDVGLEARTAQRRGKAGFSMYGFAGVGAGARSYNYRSLDVDATHNLAGYASVGSEARMRRVGFRIEARDYTSGFRPLMTAGRSRTRNDVVVLATMTFNPFSGESR